MPCQCIESFGLTLQPAYFFASGLTLSQVLAILVCMMTERTHTATPTATKEVSMDKRAKDLESIDTISVI